MRTTLAELRQPDMPAIDLLEIISVEGQRYMARLTVGERLLVLTDTEGKSCLFRSSEELRQALSGLDIQRTDMVHPSAYHEMIGMNSSHIEPLRLRLQGDNP